jgi:hypothetical protein
MAVRWIVGVILLALAALIVAGNIVGGVRAVRAGRGFSSVPFLAAALGVIAVIVLPMANRTWQFGAILLLDFTVPMALVAVARHVLGSQRGDG